MSRLNFQSGIIELNISGHIFSVKADSAFAENVSLLSGEAENRAMLAAVSGSYPRTAEFLCRIVNRLLGDGATNIIFEACEPDVFDLCDIISYICDEFAKYRKSRLKRLYESSYTLEVIK